MEISSKKAVVGTAISLFLVGIAAPVAFWFLTVGIDAAFGWESVLGPPASSIVCAASILIGVFWISWAWGYLHFVGRGLPLEIFGRPLHPTQYLVTTGPYAYTRNPMVLGLLFILLGLAFLRGSISGFWLVPVIGISAWLYLIEFEEPGLIKRFGADYEHYRNSVPVLFPRLSAYIHVPTE